MEESFLFFDGEDSIFMQHLGLGIVCVFYNNSANGILVHTGYLGT